MAKYQKPGFFTKHVANPLLELMMKLGMSARGSRILSVKGRRSGKTYTTPVNPLSFEDQRYLVAPRGETGWVKNIRVSREGELRLGGKREPIRVEEVGNDVKEPILRAYLANWKAETSIFFGGVTDESPAEELRRIAPDHPIFRIV
ncbi:MAG TPA: nitroreductase/quinone reductase family protein [Dehalococcoidia bacterium]|nr:nitroreductase/quinone reductase family protein [Dehalococcoidia bacterium]